jgi:hypothetical protein
MAASQERAQRGADPRDDLDAEAAYYRYRAIQEEQALGPGYYVDLLRGMATERAALAQRIRTGKAATKGHCCVSGRRARSMAACAV